MALDTAAAESFVLSAPRPAMLATTRPDGSPHVAPIWIDLDAGDILFNTGADTVKGRNLAADPRVAVSVQDDAPPYAFATAFGTATLIDNLEQVRTWAGRLGGRYLGAERAEEMANRNGVPGELLVRVHVDRWVGALDISV